MTGPADPAGYVQEGVCTCSMVLVRVLPSGPLTEVWRDPECGLSTHRVEARCAAKRREP